jgi:CDP-paratose 2-epimerase
MKRVLITGGAGFIGCNTAAGFAQDGWQVTIIDDLSRKNTSKNLEWLRSHHNIEFHKIDIRNTKALEDAVSQQPFDALIHLAGQVAVTTSVVDPREDFEINAQGTFNVLEAVRQHSPDTFVIFASTNKVYGEMASESVVERDGRYQYRDIPDGISEAHNLDFHSPYGCSKGSADQYVIDYSRIYGIRTVVFRQSCIYGYRQFGVEDQGWVAWFIIATVLGRKVTIYGDGKQVRDLLFVDDLVSLYKTAIEKKEVCSGKAYNVGGGRENVLSLLELVDHLQKKLNISIQPSFDGWRAGDQKVFVSNLGKVKKELGWQPKICVEDGLGKLIHWVQENKALFEKAD